MAGGTTGRNGWTIVDMKEDWRAIFNAVPASKVIGNGK
jgi:hypothetical protein